VQAIIILFQVFYFLKFNLLFVKYFFSSFSESIENSEVIESNVSLNESMQKNFAVVYCGRGFDSEIVTKRKKNY
jgi:hypothetical protein